MRHFHLFSSETLYTTDCLQGSIFTYLFTLPTDTHTHTQEYTHSDTQVHHPPPTHTYTFMPFHIYAVYMRKFTNTHIKHIYPCTNIFRNTMTHRQTHTNRNAHTLQCIHKQSANRGELCLILPASRQLFRIAHIALK